MIEFRGVYPALITPTTKNGELNELALRKIVEFDIRSGVHGFWVAGGSGESVLLTDEENMRIASIVTSQNRKRAKIIMHVGTLTTRRSVKLAEHAAKAGADAICCVPPFFYGTSDDAIVEHYRVVAAAANLPLFVYNLPVCTHVEITPTLIKKIQDRVPQLVGLKHSSLRFNELRSYTNLGLTIFTGIAETMLPGLTIGSAGQIDGPPCVAPELFMDIWNAHEAGDLCRAEAAQRRADVYDAILDSVPYHAGLKAAATDRFGIECGSPKPPMMQLTKEQREFIKRELTAFGLPPAVVDL